MQSERGSRRDFDTRAGATTCRRGVAGLCLLLVTVVLAGCRGPVASTRTTKAVDMPALKIVCPDELSRQAITRLGHDWATTQGIRLESTPYDPKVGPEAISDAAAWIVPTAEMPRYAAAGKLHAVPAQYTQNKGDYAWENLLPVYRFKLLVWDQAAFALPLMDEPLLCFYREDLLRESKHVDAYRNKHGRGLGPPATWQELADIAELFHNQPRPGIDRPCPGLPPLSTSNTGLDQEFFAVAASIARRGIREDELRKPPSVEIFSFHYDLNTGAARIATAGFGNALELMRRLQGYRPAGAALDPPESFARGEAVFCLASPRWIRRFNEAPATRGKFRVMRPPGSSVVADYSTGAIQKLTGVNFVPYLGASGLVAVVPTSNPAPDAAFALLTSITGPNNTCRDLVTDPTWGGGIFRREHLEARMGWGGFGLPEGRTEPFIDLLRQTYVHAGLINPLLRLRTPDEREHQLALLEEIRNVLLANKDPQQALSAAARKWKTLDDAKDPKLRLGDYRMSLSLSR